MKRFKPVKTLRKLIVLLTGLPILIIGLILIPLPGPGLLVSLLGFIILAQEFEWAEKHAARLKQAAKNIIDQAKNK